MTIEWNRVTWYSKLLAVILFVLTFYIGFKLGEQKTAVSKLDNSVPATKQIPTSSPISITTQKIQEENFTGSVVKISGTTILAKTAEAYVTKTVDDFRTEANTDVPDIRAKFGTDSPPATYEIDINAKDLKGPKTESIVMTIYAYTGGANGNSTYKVITADNSSGKIVSLADIIQSSQQVAFTALVKKDLDAWQPEGTTAPVVFTDQVNDLTFNSFTNWSMDDMNLIIYFDKYAVGPGVLGAVAFPIPLSTIKNFLK